MGKVEHGNGGTDERAGKEERKAVSGIARQAEEIASLLAHSRRTGTGEKTLHIRRRRGKFGGMFEQMGITGGWRWMIFMG